MPADDPKTYTLAEELFELCRVLTAAYPQVRCAALGRMLAEDFWPEADGSDEDDGPWSEAESEGGAITPILDALAAWRERRDAAATAWGLPTVGHPGEGLFAQRYAAINEWIEQSRQRGDAERALSAVLMAAMVGGLERLRESGGDEAAAMLWLDAIFHHTVALRRPPQSDRAAKHLHPEEFRWHKLGRDAFYARHWSPLRHGPVDASVLRCASRRYVLECRDTAAAPGDEADIVLKGDAPVGPRLPEGAIAAMTLDAGTGPLTHAPRRIATDGRVLGLPRERNGCLVLEANGHVHLTSLGPKGFGVNIGGLNLAVKLHNKPKPGPGEIVFYDADFGPRAPHGPVTIVVADGRVQEIVTDGKAAIPTHGVAVAMNVAGAGMIPPQVREGAPVTFSLPERLGDAREIWEGGPRLLADGQYRDDAIEEDVYATELRAQRRAYPSPGAMLRPRVAVGVTEVFEIVTACVTGDRMETSVGISLREMARLMKDLGCVSAMSFSDDLGCALAVAPEVVERLGKEVAPFIKSADDLARAATLWTWRVRGLA